jgi:adenine deaminase
MDNRIDAVACARGDKPFDISITNIQLINVLTREIYPADIGITGERIAYVQPAGAYSIEARQTIDGNGLWASPGFIDGHVHNESAMSTPAHWAEVILPKGTTTVVTDPHEIANVLGLRGVKYMLEASAGLPLRYFVTAPSCVPAVPSLETAGATFTANEIREMLTWDRVIAIAEAMDFVGLSNQTGSITSIVETGQQAGVPIEGHGPGLTGRQLQAYLTAAGPRSSDHESLDAANMLEKVRSGSIVYARISSFMNAAADLVNAIHSVPEPRMFGMCTDDIHPDLLVKFGHIDHGMRTLIAAGADPLIVYQMASINVAQHYSLHGLGSISPGWLADLVLLDDLKQVRVRHVIAGGVLRVKDRQLVEAIHEPITPIVENSVILPHGLTVEHLTPSSSSGQENFNAINLNNIADTSLETVHIPTDNGKIRFPLPNGICLAAVIGRHGQGKPPSLAFITGYPLQSGAIASTVSHDSHNLVIIGKAPIDLLRAARILEKIGGGLTAVNNGQELFSIPLPIAGLLSPLPIDEINGQIDKMKSVLPELGLRNEFPSALIWLTLPVLPRFRLSDRGLVDVISQKIIPLEAGKGSS